MNLEEFRIRLNFICDQYGGYGRNSSLYTDVVLKIYDPEIGYKFIDIVSMYVGDNQDSLNKFILIPAKTNLQEADSDGIGKLLDGNHKLVEKIKQLEEHLLANSFDDEEEIEKPETRNNDREFIDQINALKLENERLKDQIRILKLSTVVDGKKKVTKGRPKKQNPEIEND